MKILAYFGLTNDDKIDVERLKKKENICTFVTSSCQDDVVAYRLIDQYSSVVFTIFVLLFGMVLLYT